MSKKKKENNITVSFVDSNSAEDVTGSFIYIQTPNYKIAVDCGLSQSNDKHADFLANNKKLKEVKAKDLDFVFLTHMHGDHSLLTPKLYRDGFRGATIITYGSKDILKVMSEDSAKISERDVLLLNNQYNKKYKPLYSIADVHKMLEYTIEKPVNEKIKINEELSFELIPSGHLLFSCQVLLYITVNETVKKILITGDIGNKNIHNYFVGKYQQVDRFIDLAVVETTYGDRPELKNSNKERMNDLNKLKSVIDMQVHEMKGKVLLPTFALSRSQQLATMIYQLYKDKDWQPKVYIDSPLSISIFKEYEKILDGEDKKIFDELLQWENLIFVKEPDESKALVESKEPCCILSTAGFCQIGRVRNHLKSIVSNPNATVLFSGYASPDSLAGILRDPKIKTIKIDEKDYKVKCACFNLKSMSSHMPFDQMIESYSNMNCNKIVLHHGSKNAKETFAKKLKETLEKKCKSTRVVIANSSLKFNL